MFNTVVIIVSGSIIDNWTSMTLSRSKDEMTGNLSVEIFRSLTSPPFPVMTQASKGRPILVYISGQLAFTGTIDTRTGNADANSYVVSISARGKTKSLVDSSHSHKTGTMKKTSSRKVVEELCKPEKLSVEWIAEDQEIERSVFRDGGRSSEEIHRVASENAHFAYETRDGKLRVTDGTAKKSGIALILGQNILSFSAEQSESEEKSEIQVKGKRNPKNVRGRAALENTQASVKDKSVKTKRKLVVHHFGDGTDKSLKRRAKFEADKRKSASMNVKIDLFGVNGDLDIGMEHMVSIPTEGINTIMECTGLEFTANSTDTLKTSITLSPIPSSGAASGSLASFAALAIINNNDEYPSPWTSAVLSDVIEEIEETATGLASLLTDDPKLTLTKGL